MRCPMSRRPPCRTVRGEFWTQWDCPGFKHHNERPLLARVRVDADPGSAGTDYGHIHIRREAHITSAPIDAVARSRVRFMAANAMGGPE
jgi:hypothetical protein